MIHEKSNLIKHCSGSIGPGGIKCPCCFPQSKNAKKELFRQLMKAYRRKQKQLIANEYYESRDDSE